MLILLLIHVFFTFIDTVLIIIEDCSIGFCSVFTQVELTCSSTFKVAQTNSFLWGCCKVLPAAVLSPPLGVSAETGGSLWCWSLLIVGQPRTRSSHSLTWTCSWSPGSGPKTHPVNGVKYGVSQLRQVQEQERTSSFMDLSVSLQCVPGKGQRCVDRHCLLHWWSWSGKGRVWRRLGALLQSGSWTSAPDRERFQSY